MFSIFQNLGPELPFTLILLALLGLRAKVTPRASLWVNASPDKLWTLLDVYDGKIENWGRTTARGTPADTVESSAAGRTLRVVRAEGERAVG